ncbi:MAG: hypothetical protein AMXMBFR79_17860 [Chitinophagaceae bacterium]
MFILLSNYSFAQKNKYNSQVKVSLPLIYNNSNGVYYALGSRKEPTGSAVSYGINVNYSRNIIFKGLYVTAGAGYFRQAFGIRRPFHYDSPYRPLWHTESYLYNNIHLLAGMGYKLNLSNTIKLNVNAMYNQFYSYQQKYILSKEYKSGQVNNKKATLGEMTNISFGLEKKINNKFSVGLDAIVPVHIQWNNDVMFYWYEYSNDTQKIARNRHSLGASVSCIYYF